MIKVKFGLLTIDNGGINLLDTYGRKYINTFIKGVAKSFLKMKLKANQITIFAFIIGISTGVFINFNKPFIAIIMLWISGLLDAVDGSMARLEKNITPWGTLMDITFDRIVEISIIIGLAIRYPDTTLELLILTSAIIFSMTVFLTVGALSNKKGIKSFYYQAGIAERTEGFILFTLMIVFNNYITFITNIYSLIVIITALQRMLEAKKIFTKYN